MAHICDLAMFGRFNKTSFQFFLNLTFDQPVLNTSVELQIYLFLQICEVSTIGCSHLCLWPRTHFLARYACQRNGEINIQQTQNKDKITSVKRFSTNPGTKTKKIKHKVLEIFFCYWWLGPELPTLSLGQIQKILFGVASPSKSNKKQ